MAAGAGRVDRADQRDGYQKNEGSDEGEDDHEWSPYDLDEKSKLDTKHTPSVFNRLQSNKCAGKSSKKDN